MSARRPAPRLRRALGRLGVIVLVGLTTLVAGRIAAGLSPATAGIAAAVIVVGVGLVLAIVARPEIGGLAILCIVAAVPIDTLFDYDIRFLSGGLTATDVLLFLSLGAWMISWVVDRRPVQLPSPAVCALILAFVGLAFLGVVTASTTGVEFKFSLLELRAILALLLVFPIVDGIRRIEDLEWALAVFLVAVAASDAVITRDFLLGRGTLALFAEGALRINNLVYLYPMAGIVWAITLIPFVRRRTTLFLLVGLTGFSAAALFFTYRRGAWVAALLAIVAVAVLLPRLRRGRYGRQLFVMAIAVAVVIAGTNQLATRPIASPLESARERLASFGESADDISTQHRIAEFRRARDLIFDHPLTGIGLGATITFRSPLYDTLAQASDIPTTNIYVHDSFLWVALKLGLPALAVFLVLLAVVLKQAYTGYRRMTNPRASRLMLGALATLIALVLVSLSEPHLTYVGSAPLFVAMIAVSQVVPKLEKPMPDRRT